MTRAISQIVADKNRARGHTLNERGDVTQAAVGQKVLHFLTAIKHGKGVAAENELIAAKNEAKLQGELAKYDAGSLAYADIFEAHLVAVMAERKAKASVKVTGVPVEEVDDLGSDDTFAVAAQ